MFNIYRMLILALKKVQMVKITPSEISTIRWKNPCNIYHPPTLLNAIRKILAMDCHAAIHIACAQNKGWSLEYKSAETYYIEWLANIKSLFRALFCCTQNCENQRILNSWFAQIHICLGRLDIWIFWDSCFI